MKNGETYQNKMDQCTFFLFVTVANTNQNFQIKATFKAIEAYRNVSGAHWDNTNGANVEGSASAAVFEGYVSLKV
jgi:hypothetical protein